LADLRILQLDARLHREMGGGSGGEVGQERDRERERRIHFSHSRVDLEEIEAGALRAGRHDVLKKIREERRTGEVTWIVDSRAPALATRKVPGSISNRKGSPCCSEKLRIICHTGQ
jgi:hypothetical protein